MFLGYDQLLKQDSTKLAQLGDSFRELGKKNLSFTLGPENTEAFDAIKNVITSAPILKY